MTSTTPPTSAEASRQRLPAASRSCPPSPCPFSLRCTARRASRKPRHVMASQTAPNRLRRAGVFNRGGAQAVEAKNGLVVGIVNRQECFRAAQLVTPAGVTAAEIRLALLRRSRMLPERISCGSALRARPSQSSPPRQRPCGSPQPCATARKISAFSPARIRNDIRLLSSTASLGTARHLSCCTHSNSTARNDSRQPRAALFQDATGPPQTPTASPTSPHRTRRFRRQTSASSHGPGSAPD
jgi:hypothetical protein